MLVPFPKLTALRSRYSVFISSATMNGIPPFLNVVPQVVQTRENLVCFSTKIKAKEKWGFEKNDLSLFFSKGGKSSTGKKRFLLSILRGRPNFESPPQVLKLQMFELRLFASPPVNQLHSNRNRLVLGGAHEDDGSLVSSRPIDLLVRCDFRPLHTSRTVWLAAAAA